MTPKSATPKPTPSKSTPPEQVSIRGGRLPDALFRPQDRGGVVALLLPLARRDQLLDQFFDGFRERANPDHPVRFVDGGLHESCLPAPLRDASRAHEGISDALVFGASRDRVLIEGEADGGWGYVPAGTPLPDPDRGWTHDAWEDLLPELTPENGSLFLLLPAEFTGARVLARKSDRQVALTLASARGGRSGFAFLLLVLLFAVISGLAWLTGWLTPMGLPAPDAISPVLEDLLQRLPRPGAGGPS